ncbi:MAG: aromatic amino acid lyase, partial [Micrococcaceae bacterium]|nr:aromatic amino acid lyase [Micrococcaceae bacterium]
MAETITLSPAPLAAHDVVQVARHEARVEISGESLSAMAESRRVIDGLVTDTRPHYGVSTGFGALATKQIPVELRAQLQRSLIRSHAASSGAEVDREIVRGLMLNRLHTMTTGRTGVRPEVARAYAAVLNAGITPVVGEYGSGGCYGGLAPRSHWALGGM